MYFANRDSVKPPLRNTVKVGKLSGLFSAEEAPIATIGSNVISEPLEEECAFVVEGGI